MTYLQIDSCQLQHKSWSDHQGHHYQHPNLEKNQGRNGNHYCCNLLPQEPQGFGGDDDDDDDEFKTRNQEEELDSDTDSEELFEINLIVKEPLDTIREEYCESTVFSIDILDKDVVYVAVGVDGGGSSMEALSWALKHAVTPSSSTTVTLIHVFPQLNLIPTPCKSYIF